MDHIIQAAAIIGAVTGIVTFFVKIYTGVRNIEKRFEDFEKNIATDSMYIYKIAVLSEELPLVDRIHAGERYIAKGGNGIIKKKYEKLLKEYEEKEV